MRIISDMDSPLEMACISNIEQVYFSLQNLSSVKTEFHDSMQLRNNFDKLINLIHRVKSNNKFMNSSSIPCRLCIKWLASTKKIRT